MIPQVFGGSQPVHQQPDAIGSVGDDTQSSNFFSWFSNRDGNRVCVDIETSKSYAAHSTDSPFACGAVLLTRRNPRIRENGGRSFYFAKDDARSASQFVHGDQCLPNSRRRL
jgi:hypothetical protein